MSLVELLGLDPTDMVTRFESAVAAGTATAIRERLDAGVDLDYQLSVPQVAEVLGVDESTVRDYTELPEGNPRRLHFVTTTDNARGKRILVSQIADWQQRNRTDPDSPDALRRKANKARQTRRDRVVRG